MIELWTINRWLRFTGFRLTVGIPSDPNKPLTIGFKWWGWGFLRTRV